MSYENASGGTIKWKDYQKALPSGTQYTENRIVNAAEKKEAHR